MPDLTQKSAPGGEQPVSATPKVESISQADLRREINAPPRESRPVPKSDSPDPKTEKRPAVFKDGERGEMRMGDDKGPSSDPLPDFNRRAKELLAKKEAETTDDAPPPKKAEAAPKKEAKVDDKAPEAKSDAPAEVSPEQAITELEEASRDPHMKPASKARFNQLFAELKKANAALSVERTRAKELETKVSDPAANESFKKLQEEHQKANDELVKFRRRYDLENDPEFKTKYEEPVAAAEATIEATLKKYNLDDNTLAAIKKAGGFGAFSRSSMTFPVQVKGEDNEVKTVQKTAAELSRDWLNALAVADSESIKALVGKQSLLSEEKRAAMQRASDDAKTYFESRKAESAKAQENMTKEQQRVAAEYDAFVKKTEGETDWIKDKAIPDDASAEQKSEIEKENEFRKSLRESLRAVPKSAQEFGQMVLNSVRSKHLERESAAQAERIKSLEAELSKAKGAMRTTRKAGSLLTSPAKGGDGEQQNPGSTDFVNAFKRAAEKRLASVDE